MKFMKFVFLRITSYFYTTFLVRVDVACKGTEISKILEILSCFLKETWVSLRIAATEVD
jgi:hypothetical protein